MFFLIYDIILIGDVMLIAVDKNSYKVAKNDGNKYIYLYDDEPLQDLMKTKLLCIDYRECELVDINTTQFNIDCKKRASIDEKDWNILPDKINYKIGIIIPNYNYEHTIEKCLSSIFNQTYQNFEVIFVDDMSIDKSVEIAKKTYVKNYLQFGDVIFMNDPKKMKIVQLKQKRLNGGARNEAYLHLSDDVDYVYYIDSDDWLIDKFALEKINDKLQSKPDVLFVGIAHYKNNKTEEDFIPEYLDKYQAMQGWSGSCGKVIKKSLATRQECLYNEGTLKEDRNQHFKICINMKSFACLKELIYVWNQENMKSVTTIRNTLWETSTIRHYADTYQLYLDYKGQDKRLDEILRDRVIKTKREIEIGGTKQW